MRIYAESCGFTRAGLIRLRVSSACRSILSQILIGKCGGVLLKSVMKLLLNVCVVCSALFILRRSAGMSWKVTPCSSIKSCSIFDSSLSSLCSFGVKLHLRSISVLFLYDSRMLCFVRDGMGTASM